MDDLDMKKEHDNSAVVNVLGVDGEDEKHGYDAPREVRLLSLCLALSLELNFCSSCFFSG
jgi:hypothetical protein